MQDPTTTNLHNEIYEAVQTAKRAGGPVPLKTLRDRIRMQKGYPASMNQLIESAICAHSIHQGLPIEFEKDGTAPTPLRDGGDIF